LRWARREDGQAFALSVVMLVALLGMAALAIDVSSWYQTQRHDQAIVDAAALAGAQQLPNDPADAISTAVSYASKNGVTLAPSEVKVVSVEDTNDTIKVAIKRPSGAFFSRVFGIDSVQVGAKAAARASSPAKVRWVAPIVVPTTHPMLQCSPPPCGDTTTIDLLNLHKAGSGDAAGSFSLLDLIKDDNGSVASNLLGEWMQSGFPDAMELGVYEAAPSADFNSGAFQKGLKARVGDEVLFPVYQPPIVLGGSNAQFDIVGWVAFHIDSQHASGSSGSLTGHFTEFIAQGLPGGMGGETSEDFGVHVVSLTE
jgi:Flp pilus assembly protein TadG